jgi:glycosyltransferase involved in cell wall biosynthesis
VLKKKIISYRPSHIKKFGIGYAMTRLTLAMNNDFFEADVFSITSEFKGENSHVKCFLSNLAFRLLSKIFSEQSLIDYVHRQFLKKASGYDVAYLWPGAPLVLFKKLKQQGKVIIVDAVNSHERSAKDILDKEAKSLGDIVVHSITEAKVTDESEKLKLADFIFSPSPEVTNSLRKNNVLTSKIIDTSYGLEKHELVSIEQLDNKTSSEFTVLFVGSVIARKGIHLLLEYWVESGVKGCLKVIGKIDPNIEHIINKYKTFNSIQFISFTDDLSTHYQSADVFVLPSLEEGSPLVTYMAIGAGLPCIVSPMGGGGIVRNGLEGFVINSHEKSEWVKALNLLSNNTELRKKMAYASRKRAESYTWDLVGSQRSDALKRKIG